MHRNEMLGLSNVQSTQVHILTVVRLFFDHMLNLRGMMLPKNFDQQANQGRHRCPIPPLITHRRYGVQHDDDMSSFEGWVGAWIN